MHRRLEGIRSGLNDIIGLETEINLHAEIKGMNGVDKWEAASWETDLQESQVI